MGISYLLVLALICVTRCHLLYQTTVYKIRTNSSPGIATNNGMMSAFESSSNVIPNYLQGHLAAGKKHTTVLEIVQNIRVLSWLYDLSYPAARLNNQCKSTLNFLKLEGQVPEMIKDPNILPSRLSSKQYKSNSLPGIVTNDELMPAFESSPCKNPYYMQVLSAVGVAPTTLRETNPNADGFSIPYGSSYTKAGTNVVCESTPNILGLEGLVPEMNKYHNILPLGLSSKQHKSNSLPGIVTNDELMPVFESSPSKNPYYLQGPSAAGIAPTTLNKTNSNADGFSIPYGSSYPEAGTNVVCVSTPNIFGLEDLVPEVIKYPNIYPSGLSSKQHKSHSLPGIVTNDELMPAFESSPCKNPYYMQGLSAVGVARTTLKETNPNSDGFSIPYGSSYPKAGTNVVCESTPNILGLEGLVPEMNKYHNILPLGLSSKQHKSNSLPGIVTNDELMPVFESSPSKNPYYLQGPSAAGIAPTTLNKTNSNADGFSIPYGSSYPEAGTNVMGESTPNIFGLEDLVPEVIKHANIFPLVLSSKQNNPNILPGIITRKALMPDIESSPNKNPYYLQGPSAANVTPTTVLETNLYKDGFSTPYELLYPEARLKVVCESPPNILGLEGLVPEEIEDHNIFPSGLPSKQYKSNSLPGIVTNDELMPALESSPSKNPYYLQRPSAAGIAPTTPTEINPNTDRFSIPGSSYPKARSNVVCESTPNIFRLEDLVPEVIKYPNIYPSGLSCKQHKSNSLPGIVTNDELMPAFEYSPSKNPYYLQGPLAAGISPTTPRETNPNTDRFSIPDSSYPEAGTNVVCESTPNILGLGGLVPEVMKHANIFPLGLSSKQNKPNLLPGITTRKALIPDIELSPNNNPYYLQGPSAANITPTTVLETNLNVDGFSMPYGLLYPEAGSKDVCESSPNILGLEGQVPEVIKNHHIFPSGLSSKQYKSNSLPGIVTNDKLMPAFESLPSKNQNYLQGPSAAGIALTKPRKTNSNVDRFSIPCSSFPEARSNVVCESAPNILGLLDVVPEVIKYPNIYPSGLSSKQQGSNSLPGIVTNDELMPAFESSPSKNPYYLQGPSSAGIAPTTPRETNPNTDRFSIPDSSYPEAGTNVMCESSPNILGLGGLVPEVIKHANIFPLGLSSKQNKPNLLPGITTRKALIPDIESSPNNNPYYLQGPSAANITPTTVLETNLNVDGFSMPYGLLYPEAGSKDVCESSPNILGLEGQVPEVIKNHHIFPSGLSSKQYKSNSLPGIVTNDELMPAFESSPSKNPYYLQGPSAAGIAPTTPRETNPNTDRFSIPDSSYPEAGTNVVCESTPNILGLRGLVPEVIKHANIFPLGLSSKQNKPNLLPGIITRKALIPDIELSLNNNPYYLQGPSAANITPTTVLETNLNVDGFSTPHGLLYPEAGSKDVCESPLNILGLEGQVPEVIEDYHISTSGLSSKQYKSNSLPGIVTNEELMPAFESSPSKNPYYLQGPSAACIAPTTPSETNPNADRFSIHDLSYPEARTNVVCKSTPNILGLEGLVPEEINNPNILPSGLSFKQKKSNLLPGIITRKALLPAFESSPNKNPYYLQGISAANITPTTVLEANPNVDGFSMPYGLFYPEAGSNVVCESSPNILGIEVLVPEVIKHPNIFPSELSSKQYKSNSLPGIVTNDELMRAFESLSTNNRYYLQGPSAAGVAPITVCESNPNIDGCSWPYRLCYPEFAYTVVCESAPNILGLVGIVPEVINHSKIFHSGLSPKQYMSNLLPNIGKDNGLMTDFESSHIEIPYYLQGLAAADIVPTTVRKTNPNVD